MKKSSFIAIAFILLAMTMPAISQSSPAAKNPGKPIHLTKAEFLKRVMNYEKNTKEWVYEGDKPAIIDFYADWCAPCRKVAPALDELAKEYANDVYIYKINIDKERELASVFGISNIPAFLIVPMKGKPQLTTGAAPDHAGNKQRFKQIIDDVLLK